MSSPGLLLLSYSLYTLPRRFLSSRASALLPYITPLTGHQTDRGIRGICCTPHIALQIKPLERRTETHEQSKARMGNEVVKDRARVSKK
ncbi:hypothetical protein SODALDRAFT_187909 [Sodiomyces alkalinus F11]|uniref:Uncharacterized protein n=1 Tax=Sodiomyces alkalinus (strain CBS 110278 / VKM F-3762 / F11) TaxID=1314773 RepID=A0A3N2PRG1_SODAK|nr:hypothetical protein SODALDRAFT_187909 [Sodiomyces alkalinus F11]ROT37087.1 hypothetical protein SODALDRAFT_187909 [Sodiomyces alkalinus F11]